jgi:hypothetical protein
LDVLMKICNSNNHPNPQNIGCSNEDLQSNNYPNPQNIGCSNEDLQFKQPPKFMAHTDDYENHWHIAPFYPYELGVWNWFGMRSHVPLVYFAWE